MILVELVVGKRGSLLSLAGENGEYTRKTKGTLFSVKKTPYRNTMYNQSISLHSKTMVLGGRLARRERESDTSA